MLQMLDFTIRIGSTLTFLYFDLYLYIASPPYIRFLSLHWLLSSINVIKNIVIKYFEFFIIAFQTNNESSRL